MAAVGPDLTTFKVDIDKKDGIVKVTTQTGRIGAIYWLEGDEGIAKALKLAGSLLSPAASKEQLQQIENFLHHDGIRDNPKHRDMVGRMDAIVQRLLGRSPAGAPGGPAVGGPPGGPALGPPGGPAIGGPGAGYRAPEAGVGVGDPPAAPRPSAAAAGPRPPLPGKQLHEDLDVRDPAGDLEARLNQLIETCSVESIPPHKREEYPQRLDQTLQGITAYAQEIRNLAAQLKTPDALQNQKNSLKIQIMGLQGHQAILQLAHLIPAQREASEKKWLELDEKLKSLNASYAKVKQQIAERGAGGAAHPAPAPAAAPGPMIPPAPAAHPAPAPAAAPGPMIPPAPAAGVMPHALPNTPEDIRTRLIQLKVTPRTMNHVTYDRHYQPLKAEIEKYLGYIEALKKDATRTVDQKANKERQFLLYIQLKLLEIEGLNPEANMEMNKKQAAALNSELIIRQQEYEAMRAPVQAAPPASTVYAPPPGPAPAAGPPPGDEAPPAYGE